jgi:hypothetical protein
LIYFSQERSVQSKLSSRHFASRFGFSLHLRHQVRRIVLVDFVDSLL